MRTIKLSTAFGTLAKYAVGHSKQIVVLTERNKPVAAIVPLRGVDRESIALSGHPEFLRIIARSRAQFRRGHTISLADMKAAFLTRRSPNRRLQPTKARRRPSQRSSRVARLRG